MGCIKTTDVYSHHLHTYAKVTNKIKVAPFHRRNNEGVKVVVVDDISNPYRHQANFDTRFLFTLNKIYAWKLTEYERVVMLDADNLFLRNPEELFQCGQFCAAFINPCIFHTGLFVLEVSYLILKGYFLFSLARR